MAALIIFLVIKSLPQLYLLISKSLLKFSVLAYILEVNLAIQKSS